MKAEIAGVKEGSSIGVRIFDQNEHEHRITVNWDGSVRVHETDDYPNDPADRTQEEQAIMGQVEARAKYHAQQEFPEADILHPLWDPAHLDRGVDALVNYELGEFWEEFREYYEALQDPYAFIEADRSKVPSPSFRVHKTFTLTDDNRVDEVEPVTVYYDLDGEEAFDGPGIQEFENRILLNMPRMEFDDDFAFEDEFHEIVLRHLLAQIRDVYLNMGMEPPEEYAVDGFGKFTINGDDIDMREAA